ncbi:MAG TPA: hypothetical protein V6D10_22660 [Trichocoleus sp.]|jgi:hypothetical protein
MASIILSFVGSQDPYSKNNDEGSIVSLVKHLCEQQSLIKQLVLLYTEGTQQNAIDTKDWLLSEITTLTDRTVELISVNQAFSQDPINQFLAVQEARKAVEFAQPYQTNGDTLEFNGSSGTPAMKACWNILQATGFARRSHVWQIRNPKEMKLGQARVFKDDVYALRNEFDSKVIQRQIQDYNYSGALITLQSSNLMALEMASLLQYGFYRLSFDFDRAFNSIQLIRDQIDAVWLKEISSLRQKDPKALLQEIYFNTLIQLKNQKYAGFLVSLFQLQEQILFYLVRHQLGLSISGERLQYNQSLEIIKQVDQGKLYGFLQNYTLPRGGPLDLNRSISRYVYLGIVEYHSKFASLVPLLKELNEYCDLRNRTVHEVEGVSEIDNELELTATLRKLMKQVTSIPDLSPFERLNQQLCEMYL